MLALYLPLYFRFNHKFEGQKLAQSREEGEDKERKKSVLFLVHQKRESFFQGERET